MHRNRNSSLSDLVSDFSKKRILVIGDLMLDEFIWGKVNRISPEAPVPVVEVSHTSYYPGGAANVARNLREFTGNVSVLGVVGKCPHGNHLIHLLEQGGIGLEYIQQNPNWQTIVKSRVIARQQHVVRVDRERRTSEKDLDAIRSQALLQLRTQALDKYDAFLLEDYGKGLFNQKFIEELTELILGAGKILTVDPNIHNPLRWRGGTCIKPNRQEAFFAAGIPLRDSNLSPLQDDALLEVGATLLKNWSPESLLITLGEQGMLMFQPNQQPYLLDTKAREVFDLSGAGDTAIALLTLALTSKADPIKAAEIANHAAGIVVGKLGTATLTPEELIRSFNV